MVILLLLLYIIIYAIISGDDHIIAGDGDMLSPTKNTEVWGAIKTYERSKKIDPILLIIRHTNNI